MLKREEKCFPLLPSGSETALGRRPKGDEGGLDSLFQRAKVLHLLETMCSYFKDIMAE